VTIVLAHSIAFFKYIQCFLHNESEVICG